MRRSLLLILLLTMCFAGQAQAKGLVSLSLCGTNGCHTTRDRGELDAAMQSVAQADPGQVGPWFKLRQAIGEPGRHGVMARIVAFWTPSVGVVRSDEGPMAYFSAPVPQTKRLLHRLARGLRAFPASKLPRMPGDPKAARVEQVVPAPTAMARDNGSGGGSSWAWWLLALVPAGLVFTLRRRGRWI